MTVFNLFGGIHFAIKNPGELYKYLRTRTSPAHLVRSSVARWGIPLSENERVLKSLENRHAGRRCFVIGNGPSLRLDDLEKLKNEISIASNRIYVAFPSLVWRPSYFTCIDTVYAENHGKELNELDLFKIFPHYLRSFLLRNGDPTPQGTTAYFRQLPGRFSVEGVYRGNFSGDALRGFHTGPTVTILNLQLAYYLGCRPIYLLGVDGMYEVSRKRIPHGLHGQLAVCDGEQNHFHPDYRAPGEPYVVPLPDQVQVGYSACRKFLEERGVRVLNASRQTRVAAFERVDIDRVLA